MSPLVHMSVFYMDQVLLLWDVHLVHIIKLLLVVRKITICVVLRKYIRADIKLRELWGGLGMYFILFFKIKYLFLGEDR